jgi:hypothetical protein
VSDFLSVLDAVREMLFARDQLAEAQTTAATSLVGATSHWNAVGRYSSARCQLRTRKCAMPLPLPFVLLGRDWSFAFNSIVRIQPLVQAGIGS